MSLIHFTFDFLFEECLTSIFLTLDGPSFINEWLDELLHVLKTIFGYTTIFELFSWQDSNLDVQTLIERILRLKSMVRDANKRSKHPIDLDELLEMTVDNESAAK